MKGPKKTEGLRNRFGFNIIREGRGGEVGMKARFIVDTNVGHLVRKLRMLGYDTLFINPIDDAELIRIAGEEGRVLISGDRGIFKRKFLKSGKIEGVLVDTDQAPLQQLRQITERFCRERPTPFVRCLECNTLLVSKDRESAKEKVPPYVYQTAKAYAYCSRCDQFFWEGDHVKRMRAVIDRLREEG